MAMDRGDIRGFTDRQIMIFFCGGEGFHPSRIGPLPGLKNDNCRGQLRLRAAQNSFFTEYQS